MHEYKFQIINFQIDNNAFGLNQNFISELDEAMTPFQLGFYSERFHAIIYLVAKGSKAVIGINC